MDLLPQDPRASRLTAIGLLVAVVGLVYLVFFHFTFVQPWLAAGDRIQELEQQLARYRSVAAQRAELERQLEKVRTFQKTNDYFLTGASANLAGAQLSRRLKQIIASRTPSGSQCRVTTTTALPNREPERFVRVSVGVHMRCELEGLRKVLYALESGSPFVFLDNVMLSQQCTYQRGGGCRERYMMADFNMYGYLRKRGGTDSGVSL